MSLGDTPQLVVQFAKAIQASGRYGQPDGDTNYPANALRYAMKALGESAERVNSMALDYAQRRQKTEEQAARQQAAVAKPAAAVPSPGTESAVKSPRDELTTEKARSVPAATKEPPRESGGTQQGAKQTMTLAQRICIGVTLLVVAVFMFAGGHREYLSTGYYGAPTESYTDPGRTSMDTVGILLVGGVVTWLLGIRRKRKGEPKESAPRDRPSA